MPTVISAKQFRKELRLPARTDFHHPSVLCAGKGNLLFPSALLNIVIILANEDFLVNSFKKYFKFERPSFFSKGQQSQN